MRLLLTHILVISTLSALAQTKVTADTFSFARQFSLKTLIIRSDSTYCLRESACISSFLSMGFWRKENEALSLSGLYNAAVTAKTENKTNDDSLIYFKVKDCYDNPIAGYYINFYTSDLLADTSELTNSRTDTNGMLTVKRGRFSLYTTETDEANLEDKEGNYNDIVYRPILQNAKTVTVTISFPKQMIPNNIGQNLYKFYFRKFQIKNKQLLDIETGNKYVMR